MSPEGLRGAQPSGRDLEANGWWGKRLRRILNGQSELEMLASAMGSLLRKPMQVLKSTRLNATLHTARTSWHVVLCTSVSCGFAVAAPVFPSKRNWSETCASTKTLQEANFAVLPAAEVEHVWRWSDTGPGDEKQAASGAASGQNFHDLDAES